MTIIEDAVVDQDGKKLLEGALPKDYLGLELVLLAELIKIFNRPALQTARATCSGASTNTSSTSWPRAARKKAANFSRRPAW
jgi:type I restriction enzyme M protein